VPRSPLAAGLAAVLAVAAAVGALAATGALRWVREEQRRLEAARRAARGQTRIALVNPAGAAVTLLRAGARLDDAAILAGETAALAATGETWLAAGRYFAMAHLPAGELFYPVTPDASGEGPEADGAWTVTVRPPPAEVPPPGASDSPFVFIPAGWFAMGSGRDPGHVHPVWVPGVHAASFEVTNAEFRRFLADPEGERDERSWTAAGRAWRGRNASETTASFGPGHPRHDRFGRDDQPVMLVSWHEAVAYGRWLTRRKGGGRWLFRLLTEAEWEKAARGPDAFDYGLSSELSEPQAPLYNWKKNPGALETGIGLADTRRRYLPNRYGLYHASGNAREWTQSAFAVLSAARPYREDGRGDEDRPGMRVTRGGSWYSASSVRLGLAYREEFQPELRSDELGFRIAAVLGPRAGAEAVDEAEDAKTPRRMTGVIGRRPASASLPAGGMPAGLTKGATP
jgi:formylglycine-generating enzyme required for sulfatase activity